jgi:predicted phage-related endonuclease
MEQTHEHASTKIRVGATDAATIMNANKWQTPYGLWQIKLGIVPKPDLSKKKAVQYGKKLELFVIGEILETVNAPYSPVKHNVWVENAGGDKVGYVDYVLNEDTIIEAKTTGQYNAKDWEEGVPEYYLWQVVHYFMLMPTVKKAIVGCFVGGQDLVIHEVYRDERIIEALVVAENDFLAMCEGAIPPPQTVVKKDGVKSNMDQDVAQLCLRYLDIGKEISTLKKDQELVKKALNQMVGNGNTQESENLAVSFRYEERETLNKKTLMEDFPHIEWDKYLNKSATYKISVKEKK